MKSTKRKLIHETFGGVPYDYSPLGTYIVVAPGVCGGRPTFKYTRLEVAVVLDLLATGWAVLDPAEDIIREYAQSHVTAEAIAEAIRLAKEALVTATTVAQSTQ